MNFLNNASRNIRLPKHLLFRKQSSIPETLYNNVWKKSNIRYITYVLVGCVIVEGIYGSVTNAVWDSYNQGKLYHQIEWSKFKSEDDDEE